MFINRQIATPNPFTSMKTNGIEFKNRIPSLIFSFFKDEKLWINQLVNYVNYTSYTIFNVSFQF